MGKEYQRFIMHCEYDNLVKLSSAILQSVDVKNIDSSIKFSI